MEPTPTEINAVLPLLLKLAELVYGQSSPKMMSYVGSVVKFVKGAVLLSTTLAKLHTQKSRAARLASASDKDFRLLVLLKQTRAAFRENAAAVSAHQAELAHMPDLERAFVPLILGSQTSRDSSRMQRSRTSWMHRLRCSRGSYMRLHIASSKTARTWRKDRAPGGELRFPLTRSFMSSAFWRMRP